VSGEAQERPKIIFLVEDNRGDIRLIQEALKRSTVAHEVVTVRNGMDAMSYLHREGEYSDAPRPDLILLDLNLPRKDGREVLAEIKADPSLKRIPVVVLTTSKMRMIFPKATTCTSTVTSQNLATSVSCLRLLKGLRSFG
jgi:chemotaxis family two-component system response regulator Rcp1